MSQFPPRTVFNEVTNKLSFMNIGHHEVNLTLYVSKTMTETEKFYFAPITWALESIVWFVELSTLKLQFSLRKFII
jgi:hypothetical protein